MIQGIFGPSQFFYPKEKAFKRESRFIKNFKEVSGIFPSEIYLGRMWWNTVKMELELACFFFPVMWWSHLQAIQTIDGEIAQHLSIRRKHREGVGSTLSDASLYAQGQMGALSEALHPLPGCLSQLQQRIYEVDLFEVCPLETWYKVD